MEVTMNAEAPFEILEKLLLPWVESVENPEPDRVDMVIAAEDLLTAVQALIQARWGYLAAITGLDGEGLEVLYQFCHEAAVLTLRVPLTSESPAVPTLCTLIPSASVHEQELMEMFGITVTGTPHTGHLFLPDDWPAEVYPLRKDFDAGQVKGNGRTQAPTISQVPGNKFIIPIGPQHPALKEPAHFEFAVDGEIVTDGAVRLGYAHRGIEKATEARTWTRNLYLLERICGICSHIHTLAFVLGVEKLAGVTAPPRAQAIRVLIAELERFHSHLLWFGVAAHEAGFDTLFMYTWRDRETVMDILEEVTGNRVNYSANLLGGVKFDITPEQIQMIRDGLDFLDERIRHYLEVVTTDGMFLQRTRGIGIMSAAQAELWGAVGPSARASGVPRDVRQQAPYTAYDLFPVNVILGSSGDLEARFVVRLQELLTSSQTMRHLLDNLPAGELTTRMPRRIKPGETISRVEAPRGELLYFIKSNGSNMPERIKVRTPTLCNMASVMTLAIGHQLADMPMILAGVDPCFSCNDRAVMVRTAGGNGRIWTWEQIRQHGIEHYQTNM
jgi:NADH-quinone oxidoreductase subunit D